MNLEGINIKEVLLKGNYVTFEDIAKAEEYTATHHKTVLEYLLGQGILTKELLGQAISESYFTSFADLANKPPGRELVLKIPAEVANQYHVVLVQESEHTVLVATDNPTQKDLVGILKPFFGEKKIFLAFAFFEDLENLFIHYRQSLEARFIQIIKSQKKVATEILDQIFSDALIYRASDIHFEPKEEEVWTRFRIDGVLHEVGKIPKSYYENILNRIKVQAHLKIDEHFSAQDGSIRFIKDSTNIDIRISIVPTVNGEKVVMRLLTEYVKNLGLSDLGLNDQAYSEISISAKRPFGMILVSGPTGSGKTTTLYALLKTFNHDEINITTIEDPVEYRIPSMNQIQVNAATNLTFADGLRSILRQDPDIILVGEIRDIATAEVAINAALTGHLLFSTFHANDSATVIPRLLDMGVEPYLVASTLEMVVAQRLLRRLCEACRYSVTINQTELMAQFPMVAKYFSAANNTFYRGKGCSSCNNTGYKGRVGIFEYFRINKELQELIVKIPTSKEILDLVRNKGFRTLFEDGLEKIKNGTTSLEELIRVSPPTL